VLKRITCFLILAVFLSTASVFAYEVKDAILLKGAFSVKVDGNYINSPAHYNYETGVVYFPLRAVFETLGFNVSWNGESRLITINSNGEKTSDYISDYKPAQFEYNNAKVYPDSALIQIDGNPVECDMFMFENRTYISAETLEPYMAHVYVDSATQTARVYSVNYKTLDKDTAAVYGDNKKLNYTQFFDLVKFMYGNVETGASFGFADLENYLLFNGAVKKISDELGLKVTNEEKFEFAKANNVEETLTARNVSDKKFFNDEILTDYVLREKLTASDKKELYTPTDEELKNWYSTLAESKGIWLQAQHILISKDEKGDGLKKAEELLKKVNSNGADFTDIMLENSQDPGSISTPEGYIFTEGQMVEPFYKGALDLKEGEISGIVESEYGYHIIKKIKHWENGIPLEEIKDAVISSYNNKVFGEKLYEYAAEDDVFFIKDSIINKYSETKEN